MFSCWVLIKLSCARLQKGGRLEIIAQRVDFLMFILDVWQEFLQHCRRMVHLGQAPISSLESKKRYKLLTGYAKSCAAKLSSAVNKIPLVDKSLVNG